MQDNQSQKESLKLKETFVNEQQGFVQDKQRKALEKGQMLRNQLLKTVQEQSLKLKDNEFLIVKTQVNSHDGVSYNIKLQKEHKQILNKTTSVLGGLLTGALTLYLYKKYLSKNGQKDSKIQLVTYGPTNYGPPQPWYYSAYINNHNPMGHMQTLCQELIELDDKLLEQNEINHRLSEQMQYRKLTEPTNAPIITKLENDIEKIRGVWMEFARERYTIDMSEKIKNTFNAEKDFTKAMGISAEKHICIVGLQPAEDWKEIMRRLLKVRGISTKAFINIFKMLIIKMK